MILVGIYARVSSEKQEQDGTIESQLAALRKYAAEKGYVIAQEYVDDGFSGDLLNRPALDRLRDDAAAKRFERVIIHSPDRLSRKHIYAGIILEELRTRLVPVEFLNQRNDESDEGRLLLGVSSLFAEYEKAKHLERCRRGKRHRVDAGQIVTSLPPYGYDYVPRNGNQRGHLVVNEDQARIVRLIFSLCANDGISGRGIVRELRQRGIRPPGRQGATEFWAKSSIMRILHCETYTGVWHYGKHRGTVPERRARKNLIRRRLKTSLRVNPRSQWIAVPGGAPVIIDRNVFERAQDQLSKNAAFSPRNTKRQYLIGGLCVCAICDKAYVGDASHGKTVYRCNGQRGHGAARICFNPQIAGPKIEDAVWAGIKDFLENPQTLLARMESVANSGRARFMDAEAQREEIGRQRAALTAAEERLMQAYSAGIITMDQLRAQIERQHQKSAHLEQREKSLVEQPTDPGARARAVKFCRQLHRGLAQVESDFTQKRHLLRLLVDRIIIAPGKAIVRGAIPAMIAASAAVMPLPAANCGHNVIKVGPQSNRILFEIEVPLAA